MYIVETKSLLNLNVLLNQYLLEFVLMSRYGQAAVEAAKLATSKKGLDPVNAWEKATVQIFGKGTPSQRKSCPRGAFLGLCSAGLIKNLASGDYTRSKLNKKYAIDAISILRRNPDLVHEKLELWKKVVKGDSKRHNEQMEVAIALWENGFIDH